MSSTIVAVTGGTGFIGRALVRRHLARGDEVRVLTRGSEVADEARRFQGDLLSSEGLAEFLEGADVLYHCAGQLSDPALMRSLHVDGTLRLAEAAAGRIGHWVQLSSVGVYGPVFAGLIDEDAPLNPAGEYEVTKAESDRIVREFSGKGSFSASFLRPSIVFGQDMSNQSLFKMIQMIERGLFFFIGSPGAAANYVHVDNVAQALVMLGTLPQAKGGTYNLSDHRTMEEFVGEIALLLGKKAPRLRLPERFARAIAKIMRLKPGFPLTESRVDALTNRSRYSIERIRALGYGPVVSMEEGLRELVAAYRQGAHR